MPGGVNHGGRLSTDSSFKRAAEASERDGRGFAMSSHSENRTPTAGPLSLIQLEKLGIDQRMVDRLRDLAPVKPESPIADGLSFFHVARRERNDSERT